MIIQPGLRRSLGGGLAAALAYAGFIQPLQSSLALIRGSGTATDTRALAAYAFNSSGNLASVAANTARFNYANGVSLGFLSEQASANVLAANHRLAAGWTLSGGTGTIANSGTGIDGVVNSALTVSDTSITVISNYAISATALTSGILTHVGAVWIKKNSATYIPQILSYLSGGVTPVTAAVKIDTATGALSADSNINAYVVDGVLLGSSDYWLVVQPVTDNGTGNTTQSIYVYPAIRATLNGANDATLTGSVVVDWAQVERNKTYASFPIDGAGTLNADVESIATSGNIIAASGTIALTYTPMHNPSGTVFLWGTYVDASNYTAILHDGTNLIFRKRIAATNYDATIANAFVAGTTYKMAASWGSAGTSIALDGTLGTPNANTTAAQIGATMQTGADGNGANQPGMCLQNNYIWLSQLSDVVLTGFTA